MFPKRFALDVGDVVIAERNRPRGWLEKSIQASQQRRLTAARKADDDEKLPRHHVKGDTLECLIPVGIGQREVSDRQKRLHHAKIENEP